ncbi:hypothetical protein KFK09_018379 [Dendrobium nobile]|uniref:DUF7963 domain-containing protein n=1 Tax=Dendrobium nobile TaxID=94219 RepID=A0A8T3AVL5_DENNO|nr:hypothetical protein KFK09_018379 [Dendrobium nobile]
MATVSASPSADELASKVAHKRYEGLLMVRSKALRGKGAWYWAHLEPILIQTSDTGIPNAVKLRCTLCDTFFSASNPSRTATEHLKRGTCPNFTSQPKPITSIPHQVNNRKRSYAVDVVYSSSSTPPQQPHLMLSGGKDDLGPLALLEDSVKKLKSPKTSPGLALSKAQVDSAVSLLTEWVYECAGAVSFSSIEHPKFQAFLSQVGMPSIPRQLLAGARLDARYEEARSDADARIREAKIFQLAADGWKSCSSPDDDCFVSLTVNLPNGTTVFRRAILTHGRVHFSYAEEVLRDTVVDVSGGVGGANRCAGIVSNRFHSKALRNLESRNPWMVNLSCQLEAFRSLLNDFARDLPLFHNVTTRTSKIASFFNDISPARTILHKYQLHELDRIRLLHSPSSSMHGNFSPIFAMLDDIISSARPLQLAVRDESYKILFLEDPDARELAEMISNNGFWKDLQAAHSLVKLIRNMMRDIESTRPLIGQCLPLWDDLRLKLKKWCAKYSIEETAACKVFDKRFRKNYHPAWAAAFILDPVYLSKDSSGKYLPPYEYLTPEQEKDVGKVITRLASREEAHIVLNELMKWRSEGMDPLYAQAVQVKQIDPATGKMRIANPQSSRLVWETCLSEGFGSLAKVAVRLIFLHATAFGFRCNLSLLRWVSKQGWSKPGMERALKVVFVSAQSKLERKDFSNEEEKDSELFGNGEDDPLDETFFDASSL